MTDKTCEKCKYLINDCDGGCYWCKDPKKEKCPCSTCNVETRNNFEPKKEMN